PYVETEAVEFLFRYPDTGPSDLYALGVPRETPVLNESEPALVAAEAEKPEAENIQQILDGIAAAAKGFDDYFAIGILTPADAAWHAGTPMLIWHKGLKSRLEYGLVDPDTPAPKPPSKDADQRDWWASRLRQLWFVPN